MTSRRDPFAPTAKRAKKARVVPFDFVLEELAALSPSTRPMFGCTAVYLQERIVFVLRQKGDVDDGVWFAYEPEREAEVLASFPALLPIEVLGPVRGWRKLPSGAGSFEEDLLRACKLLAAGDDRLGKLPVSVRRRESLRARADARASTTASKAATRRKRSRAGAQK